MKARIFAWISEIVIEALILAGLLIGLAHESRGAALEDILALQLVFYFGMSGYMVTTLIARIIWKRAWLFYYSLFAPILFLVHFEILNRIVASGLMDVERAVFRLVGACVTIIVTLSVSLVLKRRESYLIKEAT